VTKIEEEKQAARRESAMEIISRDEKNREVMACVASNKSTLIIGRNSVVAAPEEREAVMVLPMTPSPLFLVLP
jgi:hypothetical protein